MKLELDQHAMKGLISEAILTSFDEEKRNLLIKAALQHLLEPASNGRGFDPGKTPLQQAFEDATERLARQVAFDAVQGNAEVKAALETLVADAFRKFFELRRDDVADKMAEAMVKALFADRS